MSKTLKINEKYSKKDIEDILIKPKINKSIGRIRGIVPIYLDKDEKEKIIILFSGVSHLYSDQKVGNILYYVGEQKKGHDQQIKWNNKALANSNRDSALIYVFEFIEGTNKWNYLGIFELQNITEDKDKDDLRIYVFELKKSEFENNKEILSEENNFVELLKTPPSMVEEPEMITTISRKREEIFRKKIMVNYNKTCAVCRKRRLSLNGNPEVEAAHILEKKSRGEDHIQNGISLCRLHHWAFDKGLFSIDDDYKIIIKEEIKKDKNHEEIYKYEGKKILLPINKDCWPYLKCIKLHRKKHGFY